MNIDKNQHHQQCHACGQEINMKDQGPDRKEPGRQESDREHRKQDQRTHRDDQGRGDKKNPR